MFKLAIALESPDVVPCDVVLAIFKESMHILVYKSRSRTYELKVVLPFMREFIAEPGRRRLLKRLLINDKTDRQQLIYTKYYNAIKLAKQAESNPLSVAEISYDYYDIAEKKRICDEVIGIKRLGALLIFESQAALNLFTKAFSHLNNSSFEAKATSLPERADTCTGPSDLFLRTTDFYQQVIDKEEGFALLRKRLNEQLKYNDLLAQFYSHKIEMEFNVSSSNDLALK